MTIIELRNKLNNLIDDGYGDKKVGCRYYECDPRGPEEDEWYDWQFLNDIEIVDEDIYDEEDEKEVALALYFDERIYGCYEY